MRQMFLWQIGVADGGYREFALAGRHTEYLRLFPDDVQFRVGQSDPGRNWSYIHPGPADAWAGSRQHPFRILFPLNEVPEGVCRFTLHLVNTHHSVPPLLEVRINDHYSCRFRLPAGGNDASLTDPNAGRKHTLSFLFSRSHLQAGENVITLTVLEGSWLLYDALALEAGLALPETPILTDLSAETTMLFRRVNGDLKQAVRVRLNNTGLEGEVEAEQLPGGCREWYTTHSFVALSDGRCTALLATPHAPLVTFNDFFKGLWRGKLEALNGWVFAYVFNNYWDTNYKASQGGDLVFGFSLNLLEGDFDPAVATHFGWERLAEMSDPRRPAYGQARQANVQTRLPAPPAQSLLQVSSPEDVVMVGGVTWEDDRLLVRLYNTGRKHTRARLVCGRWTPREAWQADLAGRLQKKLPLHHAGVDVAVPGRRVITLAIR